MKQLTDALNSDKGTIGKLIYDRELYDDFRASLARVDTMVQGLQSSARRPNGEGTAGKLLKDPALYNEAQETIAKLNKLVDDLNAGKGTAGKLLKSDDLHNQLHATIAQDRSDDRQNQLRPGYHRSTAGESAVVRQPERRHASRCTY